MSAEEVEELINNYGLGSMVYKKYTGLTKPVKIVKISVTVQDDEDVQCELSVKTKDCRDNND